MVHYFKFRQDLFGPVAAREVYVKRGAGKGWPEECPPLRAANGFGFDVLANFDVTFVRRRGKWVAEPDVVVESDFSYSEEEGGEGRPLRQQYAWGWEKGQQLPHPITDDVYEQVRNQMKISSFLFLKTNANELLYVTDVPNLRRPWWGWTAVIDTDWYPASYPWHAVIEFDPREKRVRIEKGEPICRIIPVRRDTYFATAMTQTGFDEFFARGQDWLAEHGQPAQGKAKGEGTVDIRRRYVRQQIKSKFVVME
jgi:hypothetical protein